jgi:hypothetical protein
MVTVDFLISREPIVGVISYDADVGVRNTGRFQIANGALSIGIVVVKTRNCGCHYFIPFCRLLGGIDVAFEIDAYISCSSAFGSLSAPHAICILLQSGHVGIARTFDPALGLAFSEAVPSGYRRIRVVLTGAVDGVVVWA